MAEALLERDRMQVADSVHKVKSASIAIADAIDESAIVVKRAVKRSGDAAEELMDDAAQRFKRHPVESMAATLGLSVIAGVFIGWMISRKKS
jgi:hypothetical protein